MLGDPFVLRPHADTKIIRDLHARQPTGQRYAHRILAGFVRPCSSHSRDHATHNPAMQRIVHLLWCIICYQRSGIKPRQDHTAYRLPGSGRAHPFSPCVKKSFSTANWPISPLTHASMYCRQWIGSFEPELIQKGQTRIDGMDDNIIGLYAAGLSTRDNRPHREEVYGLRVSADLISRVTDAVLAEVSDWKNRALEPMYPIVFLDALWVKIRDAESRHVKNKAVYVALGVTPEGELEVLGLWIANSEGPNSGSQ